MTDRQRALGSFERKNYTNQENVFPFCPSVILLLVTCIGEHTSHPQGLCGASEGIRGQHLGGLKPTICKFPLHKEFQGKATVTKSKPETCCAPQPRAMKYSLPLSLGGRQMEGRGRRGASINIGKAPDCLFFQEVVPFMLQFTHLKLNTCSPQKDLAHDQSGPLQVLDFVRQNSSQVTSAKLGGLLNGPLPSCTHHHTTYYTCNPHPSCSPRSQAASGPGLPFTPQPPHNGLPTPEPHSPLAALHQPNPQKYLTTWLSLPFSLHPPYQTTGATIFQDSSVDSPLVAAVYAVI